MALSRFSNLLCGRGLRRLLVLWLMIHITNSSLSSPSQTSTSLFPTKIQIYLFHTVIRTVPYSDRDCIVFSIFLIFLPFSYRYSSIPCLVLLALGADCIPGSAYLQLTRRGGKTSLFPSSQKHLQSILLALRDTFFILLHKAKKEGKARRNDL